MEIHKCQCDICLSLEDHPEKSEHHRINLVMSQLDEKQRRIFAAHEAKRLGYGGIKKTSIITGLDEKTIKRGIDELDKELTDIPYNRVREEGGGRKLTEKKSRK